MNDQRAIVCHGGLFDGRVVTVGKDQYAQNRVEFIVSEEPEVVLPEWHHKDALAYLYVTYALARTTEYRERLVYVPTGFYLRQQNKEQQQ